MKILVTYLTGIGNTVMCIPALRALYRKFPEAVIDVVVRHQASKELLERLDCQRRVYLFNPATQKTWRQKFQFLRALRQEYYDVNITAFPSNRREFNLLSFCIGAKRRIAPRYQMGNVETFDFLQNELVTVHEDFHDIDQNLSLLAPLGISKLLWNGKDISWELTPEEHVYAEDCLQLLGLSPKELLIGFHPGCNPEQGNILKRWPADHFARLGDKLIEAFDAKILLFGDSNEAGLRETIKSLMKYQPFIPETTALLNVAALIKQRRLFVTNDSGLMHVAAAMGVPTVSLFGPSDIRRNAPYGEGHMVIPATLPCCPCNTYPHYQYGGSFIRCMHHRSRKGECMRSITVEAVYTKIVQNYADIVHS